MKVRRLLLFGTLAIAGTLAIVAEFRYLQGRQREQEARFAREREEHDAALATELVSARLDAARLHLARHDWAAALKALHEAERTENATNRDAITPLLEEAERGQAASMLEQALAALGHKDAEQASRLLEAYLADPRAAERDRAARLKAELLRATAEGQAVPFLRRLSDDQLARLDETGELPKLGDDPVTDERVRPVFVDTLRRHLPPERERRAAVRAAERAEAERLAKLHAAREAKVRDTAVYRELAAHVAGVRSAFRAERTLAEKRERALKEVFRELGIRDQQEQAMYRDKLTGEGEKSKASAPDLAARRSKAKQEFRKLDGFDDADRETFDALVDRLIDDMLEEMKRR
jgi:hypothetical protein